jgi:hypothetical protein
LFILRFLRFLQNRSAQRDRPTLYVILAIALPLSPRAHSAPRHQISFAAFNDRIRERAGSISTRTEGKIDRTKLRSSRRFVGTQV